MLGNLDKQTLGGLVDLAAESEQDTEGGNDVFLCDKSGDGCHGGLPIAEAEGCKDEAYCIAYCCKQGVVVVLNHPEGAVHNAEALEEPQHDRGQKDDGTGLLDEGPAALPSASENVADCGNVICGKLHNEGSGFACEGLGLLEHDSGDDDRRNADEVAGHGDKCAAAEECAGEHADDGHLCAAGDEAGGHDRHTAVTLVFDGTGCHDARNAAAAADEHGDEALAGEPKLTEHTVKDKCDTGHVAYVLKDAEHQEENEHLRNEAEDGSDTADDTVNDESGQPVGCAPALHELLGVALKELSGKHVVGPVGEHGTEGSHCDPVNKEHYNRKNGDRSPAVSDDLIYLVGIGKLSCILFLVARLDDGCYVDVTLIGDDAFCVVVKLLFGSFDVGVYVFEIIGLDVQSAKDLLVMLEDLYRIPALLLFGHIVQNVLLDVSDRMLDSAGEGVHRDGLGVLCGIDRSGCGFGNAGSLECRDLNDLAAELSGQLFDVDNVAVFANYIHHVDGDDYGDAQLGELSGQVQISLQVGAVDDVQYRIGTLTEEVIASNDLLKRIGREGVYAGKVNDRHIAVLFKFTFLLFYGNARPVADELICAGQGVEQGGFTAVRVARKGNFDFFFLTHLFHLDHFCVCLAQRQLIASHGQFDGISERCDLANIDLGALGDSHVHDAALYGALSVELFDGDRFADLNISQCLHFLLLLIHIFSAPFPH